MIAGSFKRALVWGGILMLVGVLAFIDVFVDLSPWVWVILFAAAGLAALAVYLTDRSDWSLLIPAYVMVVVAGLIALAEARIFRGDAIAVFVLLAIALPFLVIFLRNRRQWWALIPAYVLAVIALMLGLQELGALGEAATAPFILAAIALPFLIIFLRNRSQWWFLIPAYVLAVIALMIGLQELRILDDELTAPYVLFAIAVPFFFVYLRNSKQWWFLIPAGVLTIIGLSLLFATDVGRYIGPIILVVIGVVIAARLLRQGRLHDTAERADSE